MNRARLAVAIRPGLVGPASVLAGLGAAVLLAGAFIAPERVWPGLLVAALFTVGLGLAGLFYVAVHYAVGAGWDVVVRRVAEGVAGVAGDLYLAVYPTLHPAGPPFGGWEAGIALGTAGFLALALHQALAGAPAVPVGDPLLAESLHHHG